jgi:hypothetical protein
MACQHCVTLETLGIEAANCRAAYVACTPLQTTTMFVTESYCAMENWRSALVACQCAPSNVAFYRISHSIGQRRYIAKADQAQNTYLTCCMFTHQGRKLFVSTNKAWVIRTCNHLCIKTWRSKHRRSINRIYHLAFKPVTEALISSKT